MKIKVFLILIVSYVFTGCSRDSLTVQIARNPLIQFNMNGSPWKADTYGYSGPTTTVVYPADSSLPADLYYRYSLQASGKDSVGNPLLFYLVFDVADTTKLIGDYSVNYTNERGLSKVQLLNIGSTLVAYSLCSNDTITPILHIQKQSITERLIAGSFQMTLCNERDTSQKMVINNGILTDIHY